MLCTALVSLLVAPVSGASQDWTATKPALNMQAALESGVPAERPVTMLAKKGDGTRLAVMTSSGGEFSPPTVAGDCYKVVEAATDTSEKVRNVCTQTPTLGHTHQTLHAGAPTSAPCALSAVTQGAPVSSIIDAVLATRCRRSRARPLMPVPPSHPLQRPWWSSSLSPCFRSA